MPFSSYCNGAIDVARPEADQINAALDDLVEMVGADRLRGLSMAYQRGDFLSQLVEQTKLVLAETRSQVSDWRVTLRSFGKSDNVSVLSIHKSKGLEWDTVVLLGVENEAFFGFRDEPEEEISGLFVGLSRAKAVVAVTSCMLRTRPPGFAKRWDEQRSLELVMPFFEILDEAGVPCIVSPAIAGSAVP
jgi:superfamily I DNA/RNA helicase